MQASARDVSCNPGRDLHVSIKISRDGTTTSTPISKSCFKEAPKLVARCNALHVALAARRRMAGLEGLELSRAAGVDVQTQNPHPPCCGSDECQVLPQSCQAHRKLLYSVETSATRAARRA